VLERPHPDREELMRASSRWLAIATLLLAASCGTITSSGGTGGAGGGAGASATGRASGTGGTHGGTGGQGGAPSCDKIQAAYKVALTAARACSPDATNQCQKMASTALGCNGCPTFVNDDSNLGPFSDEWSKANCDQMQVCTAIACISPKSALCRASDAGGALCVDQQLATP
jgi:hypothetical protein